MSLFRDRKSLSRDLARKKLLFGDFFSYLSGMSNPITPEQMKDWRISKGMTQTQLGEKLGLPKAAISKIENRDRGIGATEEKFLRILMFGELPEGVHPKDSTFDFTEEQWAQIQRMAFKEGFESPTEWMAHKIRVYLAQLPESVSDSDDDGSDDKPIKLGDRSPKKAKPA